MRQLLTPRWVAAHIVVLVLGAVCVALGAWQLDRLHERREANGIAEQRFEAPPVPIGQLVAAAGSDLDSLEYRRATVTGVFEPDDELLLRSQVLDGRAGFDVITPFRLDDGRVIAVNRGWVPLEFDTTPVEAAPPPSRRVGLVGMIRPSQPRGALGQEDQGGSIIPRVDLVTMKDRFGAELIGVYLEVLGTGAVTDLPVPATTPNFEDQGPHLNYAIQWFSFALVGAVGYGFLLRRAVRSGGEAGDDFHAG